MTEPRWIEDALVADCEACQPHPGTQHDRGYTRMAKPCLACGGSAFVVLTTRREAALACLSCAPVHDEPISSPRKQRSTSQ